MRKTCILQLLLLLLVSCVGKKEPFETDSLNQQDQLFQGGEDSGTRFYRRVLAIDFTASWCKYCPKMQEALVKAGNMRPGRLVTLAVHQYDDMSAPESNALISLFNVSSLPQTVLDWDRNTMFNNPSSERIIAYIDEAVRERTCGIAAESTITDGALNITVRVKPAENKPYNVFVALVEDGITAYQNGAGENYTNNDVLCRFLGAGLDGTLLPQLQDGEGWLSFTTDAPSHPASYHLVIIVMQDNIMMNVVSLGLDDIINFRYEKDTD